MKNKKAMKIGLIGTAVLTVGVAMALIASNTGLGSILRVRGVDHDANCEWNHYDAVAATYAKHGSKEFWACCSHAGQHVLTAPAEGHITDVGPFVGDYFDNLSPSDDRYVPELEGGNKYASLDIIGWQDDALLYTKTTYSNIESVTFKMRITADATEMSSIWFAVGVADDQGDWTGLDNNFFTKVVDGEWHLYTRKMSGQSGYIKLCYNMDHVIAGQIDIDDFRIETSTATVVETFDEDTCLFGMDASHARLGGEAKQNNFARLTVNPIYDDNALLYSFAQYTSVTEVSFRLRVNGSTAKSWEGAAVNTSAYGVDQYTNMVANEAYVTDGDWHYRSFAFSDVTGYVNVINEIGHLTCDSLDIDDIVIIYDGGKLASETFDDGLVLFGTPAQLQRVMIKSEAKETKYGPLALDLVRGTLESREYSPSFDLSKGVDPTYGPYVQIDNWTALSTQNRVWLGFASEAIPEGQTRVQLGGEEISNYYFYMYNPLDNAFKVWLQFDHHYTEITTVTIAAKAWTKITVNHGTWGSYQCTDPSKIGFDHFCDSNGETVGSGFKVTSIYAKGASDNFLRLYSSTYSSGTATAYTKVEYTNITNITFDYRLTGGPQEGKGAWWGVGIASNHDIYTNMKTTSSAAWDGEWHSRTVDLSASPESGYVNLIHACGEQIEGSTIDFDNIVITYDDGKTVTETFNTGFSVFQDYTGHDSRWAILER